MAAPLKDIVTMLEQDEQPPSPPMRILSTEENARVDELMQDLLGAKPNEKEGSDGRNTA
jgi:hypothetical protein